MICIECGQLNIDKLYSKYESDYIKLTICPRCEKVADKYIEYDNVILFIDLLLLKPEAYRHLAYNVTYKELFDNDLPTPNKPSGIGSSIIRFRKLIRIVIMMVLFEVYITWAYEEKTPAHSPVNDFILKQKIHHQYLYFIGLSISKQVTFSYSIQCLFHHWLKWGQREDQRTQGLYRQNYFKVVLLVTVLVATSLKLFPIIMLIWPYDRTANVSSMVNLIGLFNLVEALRIVSGYSYKKIIIVVAVSTFNQFISSMFFSSIISHLFSNMSGYESLSQDIMSMSKQLTHEETVFFTVKESILHFINPKHRRSVSF